MTKLSNNLQPQHQIRDVLFGNLPISEWPKESTPSDEQPWSSFSEARNLLNSDHPQDAIHIYQCILDISDLESRHYLQAWHFLREVGVMPDPVVAKQILGVVVEVALAEGLDIVAAYADYTARYFKFSGAGVIWDAPDNTMNQKIDAVLQAGEVVVGQIGPWKDARPPAPPTGHARISMLTPSGLHFGEGPYAGLVNDQFGGLVISAAIELMRSLIAITKRSQD